MPQEAASGLWRSEDMEKVNIVIQREAVHATVHQLGRLACCHFVDMEKGMTAFMRPYTGDIRRCDDLERRLRYIADQMEQMEITPREQIHPTSLRKGSLEELENVLEAAERELRELNSGVEKLELESNRCREMLEILSRDLFSGMQGYQSPTINGTPASAHSKISTIAGLVETRHVDTMTRMVFRASRGNCFLNTEDLKQPFTVNKQDVLKTVFVVYGTSDIIMRKVERLCDSLGASRYDVDSQSTNIADVERQQTTVMSTLERTRNQKFGLLSKLSGSHVANFRAVEAEKAIFSTMNMIRFSGSIAKAQAWIPSADRPKLQDALNRATQQAGADVQSVVERADVEEDEVYPTYFRTNKVTAVFQGIVDSYGIAHYKEVNPGVFTIVTFPYLFGIMYGDIGHGVLLTLAAALMIIFEGRLTKAAQNEIFGMIFSGRYLLFFMGIAATYVGLLYNDFFGFSLGLFESAYTWPTLPNNEVNKGPGGMVTPTNPNGHPSIKPSSVYAFGIDVAWAETENKLEFYNSTKMKCAVVVGVIQMLVGLVMSLLNHIRKRDWMHVAFGFVPEVIFLFCTFGYMCILILVKWNTTWENTNNAPSLLETMTNFFLAPGSISTPLFSGQAGLQVFLLLVAFAQVPLMLLVIPFYEKRKHARLMAGSGGEYRMMGGDGGEAGEFPAATAPFDFSEVMIHYIIHTIEFVLGCVSNTASYLRLWALSLAHAQLSEVFFNFGLLNALGADKGSGIILMVGFAAWLGATVLVLLCMESLSAFLHALRLHWVEFQNKFYAGDGAAFMPFDIREELNLPRDD